MKEVLNYSGSFIMNFEEIEIDQFVHQIVFKSGGDQLYLCKVCHSYLKKNTLPPKAASNSLKVVHVPENIRLNSYLEESFL